MIDTFMAVWNQQRGRRRGLTLLSVFLVMCISVSLLLVIGEHLFGPHHATGGDAPHQIGAAQVTVTAPASVLATATSVIVTPTVITQTQNCGTAATTTVNALPTNDTSAYAHNGQGTNTASNPARNRKGPAGTATSLPKVRPTPVPTVQTTAPVATPTLGPTSVPTGVATATPPTVTPTSVPTSTPTPVATETPTSIATATATPTTTASTVTPTVGTTAVAVATARVARGGGGGSYPGAPQGAQNGGQGSGVPGNGNTVQPPPPQQTTQGANGNGKNASSDAGCMTDTVGIVASSDVLTTIEHNIGIILAGGLLGTILFYGGVGLLIKRKKSALC